jgi:hypothetical protein
MSYSRRQLYAMGEPLGDDATRRAVGGKVIYGSGGGGGNAEKQTTIVDLPEWAKPYAKESLGKASALTSSPYQTYGGERTAQFSPLQKQAFDAAAQQGVADQIGAGSGLAGTAGLAGLTGGYKAGQFGSQMGQYMSPYMDAVVQRQMESAQRQADIAGTQRGAQAVRAGAFGGSRQAVENAEAARALASQKGEIQAQGLQSAYDRATDMYGREQALAEQSRQAGLSTALGAAGQLGQLGQQQFGQQMGITDLQQQLGGQQRAATQEILSTQYQDFLNQQRAPFDQLSFMSSIIRGTPMGQTTTQYQPPASPTSQLLGLGIAGAGAYGAYQGAQNRAAGGEVKGYAAGGITDLNQPQMAAMAGRMSDQQLQQTRGIPSITEIAELTLDNEAKQRALRRQLTDGQEAMMAQKPQSTVAEERMAMLNRGIGGLEVPDNLVIGDDDDGGDEYTAAGGGIVAFQPGGQVDSPDDYGLPAISTSLIPQAAQDLMAKRRRLAMDAVAQERKASENYLAGIKEDETALGDIYGEREKRIKAREEGLADAASQNTNMALIRAGLKIAGGRSPDPFQNISEGAVAGLDAYMSGSERIEKTRDNIDAAAMRLAELRGSGKKENLKAVRDAQRDLDNATAQGTKALSGIYGEDAKAITNAYEKKATLAAQHAAANKPTDMRNFVRDVELAAAGGPAGQQAQIRVDAAKAYIGAQKEPQLQGAATNVQKTQAALVEQAKNYALEQIGYTGPKNVRGEYNRRVKQDKENQNKTDTAGEYLKKLEQDYIKEVESRSPSSAAPAAAAPAPASAAPAAAGTRPDISSVTGAPRGATIGAQTSMGWEIKDRSGKVIGYAQ